MNESVNPNVKWSTPDCFKLWIVEGLLYIEKGYYVQYGSDVFNGQNFKSTFLRKHSGEIIDRFKMTFINFSTKNFHLSLA